MTGIIGSIIIGILAGFFANKIMGGNGSLLWNLLLGVVGGAFGGWLLPLLGITWGGLIGQLGTAIVGAVLVLWIASMIKK